MQRWLLLADVIERILYLSKSNQIFLPYFSLLIIIYIRQMEKPRFFGQVWTRALTRDCYACATTSYHGGKLELSHIIMPLLFLFLCKKHLIVCHKMKDLHMWSHAITNVSNDSYIKKLLWLFSFIFIQPIKLFFWNKFFAISNFWMY